MSSPDTATFSRADGSATAEVDGDTVVLSPSDLRYHSLNVTAATIWEVLAEPRTLAEVVEALLDRFEVDVDTCRAEAATCLDQLCDIGAVSKGDD